MATIRQGSVWIHRGQRHHVTWADKVKVLTWNEETGARHGPGAVAWHGPPADFLANFKPAPPAPGSTREGRAARARWLDL